MTQEEHEARIDALLKRYTVEVSRQVWLGTSAKTPPGKFTNVLANTLHNVRKMAELKTKNYALWCRLNKIQHISKSRKHAERNQVAQLSAELLRLKMWNASR